MGNAMKRKAKRSLKRQTFYAVLSVKGGVVPAEDRVQFRAYEVRGKSKAARVYAETRRWIVEALKTGNLVRPNIVLDRKSGTLDK